MTGRPTVTVAIIARDEAGNLAELLPQLGWADQVVLVDGGSQDGTVEVARAHGCRVAIRRFDTFARQRNSAIRLVRSDWVFSLDADERPGPRLVEAIGRAIREPRCAAYRVAIRSWIFGRPLRRSGTQDDWRVRLFRRGAAQWDGAVHEVLRVSGRVGQLDGWLEHRTLPDLETFLAKMNRYTALEARARVLAGRAPGRMTRWVRPLGEVVRRLIAKQGLLDGPEGWAFCLLSGLSEWVLADRHRRLWEGSGRLAAGGVGVPGRGSSRTVPEATHA